MAGYNGFSMSNNAVAAYDNGLVPASKVRGVPAALVRQFCRPAEWHHTSKHYNRTDFYDPAHVRAVFGLESHPDVDADPEAVAALTATRIPADAETFTGCRVEWLEWSGTRNHPRATERAAEGCTVVVRGQTATVTLPSGATLTKRLATNGFRFSRAAR